MAVAFALVQSIELHAAGSGHACSTLGMHVQHAQSACAADEMVNDDDASVVDTSLIHTHGMTGFLPFNPASYQVQKHWRPLEGDSLFYAQRWRNITFGASTGLDFSHNWHEINKQVPIQVFLGYRFTPVHQLRLQVGYEKMEMPGNERRSTLSSEIQWLANLSTYASGYRTDRFMEISSLVGVGMRYHRGGLLFSRTPYLRAGLDVSLRIGPNVSFFLQPYIGASRAQEDAFATTDPSKINFLYGMHAGIAANLTDSRAYFAKLAPIYRSFFFEASTGWGFNLNDFNAAQSGNNDWVGVGRWLGSIFGFRVGGMAQQNYWSRQVSENKPDLASLKHHAQLDGRAELLVNLRNLKSSNRWSKQDPTWEFDLSAGIQYGFGAKADALGEGDNWHSFNYGFTTAFQTLYKVSPGSYIFFEPRFFNNLHRSSFVDDETGKSSDVDRFVTFNVGTRVYVAPKSIRRENDGVFNRNLWLGLGLGGMKMFETTRVKADGFGALQPAFSLNLGYDAHPYATVRLQGEWAQLARVQNGRKTRYSLLDLRAMYMLPFTNVVRGVDSRNRFHTYLEIGPTASFYVGQQTEGLEGNEYVSPYRVGRYSLGAMAGLFVSYDLTKRWDLYAEAQGQYNKTPDFTPGSQEQLNNLKWGLYGGVRYHFHPYLDAERERWATEVPLWMRGWFVEGSTGWTVPFRGSTRDGRQGGTWVHRSGALFNLNFGHWLTPYLGMRFGLQATQHSSATSKDEVNGVPLTIYDASASGSLTLEMLTNPLNFSKRMRQQTDRWFDLNASAGFQAGFIGMGDNFGAVNDIDEGRAKSRAVGFVATLQPLFRVSPGVWLYVEPRFSTFHFDSSHIMASAYPRSIMRNMAISAGARIVRPDRKARLTEQGDWQTDDVPDAGLAAGKGGFSTAFFPHWWVGMQVGGTRNLVNHKVVGDGYGIGIQPTASFNAGYDFHPLVTLRGQFEYGRLGHIDVGCLDAYHNNLYNLRLIYMLNMTNLWRGSRNWPRLGVYPEFGVAYSHHDGMADKSYHKSKTARDAFGMMLGVMAAYRVNKDWDVTIETQEQYHFPHSYMPAQTYGKLGNGSWNLTAGVRYHVQPGSFKQIQWKSFTPEWQRGWFLEGAYGVDVPLGNDAQFFNKSGNSWHARFGHWFNSLLGFRAGVTGSRMSWQTETVPDYMSHPLDVNYSDWKFGVRFEAMLNPLNFSVRRRHLQEQPRFDLNLAAGIDLGAGVKSHTPEKHAWKHSYVGFTASAQALLRVAPGAQVFVEPRYHTASYDAPNSLMLTTDHAFDKYFDLSIGARITRGNANMRARVKDEEDAEEAKPASPLNRLWVGVDVNDLKMLHCQSGALSKDGMQPGAGISVGYDVHPLASFRLQFKYDYLRINQPDYYTRIDLYNLRAMYMLNLTNLWRGTRQLHPRLSAYWEVGPTFSHYKQHSSMGIMTGVNVALRVAPQWDVTFESMGQYNLHHPYLPVVDRARPSDVMMEFGLGTRFRF